MAQQSGPSQPDDSHDESGEKGHAGTEFARLVYEDLRRLASAFMASERNGHTLQATALVHEAYLRLGKFRARDRDHFFRTAARTMRRVLAEAARARKAQKRNGNWAQTTLGGLSDEDQLVPTSLTPEELLDLDRSLTELSRIDMRATQVVELVAFAGFTAREAARTLGVSEGTVRRDWTFARTWLQRALTAE